MPSRACTPMHRVVCGSMVGTVRSLAWELVSIRVLSSVHYSSFWYWRCPRVSSTLVYHGSFSMLMTWCSSQTSKRSVSPSTRRGTTTGMESKGLRVNMKKTKFLVSGDGHDVLQKSGKYPCAVCCRGVEKNSILCSQCMLWVDKTCSGITKWLVEA